MQYLLKKNFSQNLALRQSEIDNLWIQILNKNLDVVDYIEIPDVLKKLGSFKEDSINIYEYGRLSFKAIKLADRVGWK